MEAVVADLRSEEIPLPHAALETVYSYFREEGIADPRDFFFSTSVDASIKFVIAKLRPTTHAVDFGKKQFHS